MCTKCCGKDQQQIKDLEGIHDNGRLMTQCGKKQNIRNKKKTYKHPKKVILDGPGTMEEQVTLRVSSLSISSFLSVASKEDSHAFPILNPIFLLVVSI